MVTTGGQEKHLASMQGISVRLESWPDARPFALFLSHDVDQIYDRELFRVLGDINHLRRMWLSTEPGSPVPCIKRVARALLRPKDPGNDIESILSIERAGGFRSTFFLLEDEVLNRLGGRYRYMDSATRHIAKSIEHCTCEIAVHGAYHNFNNSEAYKAQARSFYEAFGRKPNGIRNHELRHDGFETWRAQRQAGFGYDASFGFNDQIGVRDGKIHPFFPLDGDEEGRRDFVVLPMTIMDSAIFRVMRLPAAGALAACQHVVAQAKATKGLLCLNWHNNYFKEEEYEYWQDTYETLLSGLAEQRPWNATGEEIADWWRRRNQVRLDTEHRSDGHLIVYVHCGLVIEGLVVAIGLPESGMVLGVDGAGEAIRVSSESVEVRIPRLSPEEDTRVTLSLSSIGNRAG